MEWTGLNELREKFLSFFESKGCLRLPSFSLIPKDDNSLLLINSGMAPMKKYFTGEITPPRSRVTTCQKCIRTPDIERVGITARHGTFFEMLGNFSFGDYFKREATAWAWEFFTKVLEMPEDKLYVSIYQDDDEAYKIWTEEVGVDPSHMVRLGKEDNFWEHGSGPCGPCSEIYFDRGDEKGCGKPDCHVGCECDRFVEVWNLVFTQFESDGKGNYTPLEHPNIDTGMGLERLACVMQGVDNLFLVDTIQNIMKHICEITGVNYGDDPKNDISLRVITDHIRSTTFMIGDGVMPSNEGKGYVLRRLLRRAARHGRLLGYKEPFLYKVCETVIKENITAYPELQEKQEFITKVIRVEEESFAKTIDQGFRMLNNLIESNIKTLSGEDAFKLNDTFGFPIDLTREILGERGIKVNTERFYELLKEQKKRSRDARKNAGADAWISESTDLSDLAKTEFLGYDTLETDSKLLAIVKDGERVESISEGETAIIVLDKTPFYAESGGQVGDTGKITAEGFSAEVDDTTKDTSGNIFLHAVTVTSGTITAGADVKASTDKQRRQDIMRNHTATHLLQAALREVLGNHVQQAGQLVSESMLRFDFTHFEALTASELIDVEKLVNDKIFEAIEVQTREMPIEEAKKLGAMALFGEKYGDTVRVVSAGDFSVEFCGGTHVDNTSKLGLFKIRQEGSVASGVRRIEAITGYGVLNYINKANALIMGAATALKISNPKAVVDGVKKVNQLIKDQQKTIAELNAKLAVTKLDEFFENKQELNGINIILGRVDGCKADALRSMCERARDRDASSVTVIASLNDGKVTFASACGKDALKNGANAGKVVKAVAQAAGGNGGGKPDMAMAGAKDPEKIDSALNMVKDIISEMTK